MIASEILVIEDDPIWMGHLLLLLNEIGYKKIETSQNLEEAKSKLEKRVPSLIISDIMLGEHSIFDLFIQEPSYLKVPIIFTSMLNDEATYMQAKKVLQFSYLVKPFDLLTLRSAIDNLLKYSKRLLPQSPNGLIIKTVFNEILSIKAEDVDMIEVQQNYCTIYVKDEQHRIKISLAKLIEILGEGLLRIHRKYLVNKNSIININFKNKIVKTKYGEIKIGSNYIKQLRYDYFFSK